MCLSCSTGLTFATASLLAGGGVGLIVLVALARSDRGLGRRVMTAMASGALVFVFSFFAGGMAASSARPILAAQPWPHFPHIEAAERLVAAAIVGAMILPPVVVCWMARGRQRRGASVSRKARLVTMACAGLVGLVAGLYAVNRSDRDLNVDVDLSRLDWRPGPASGNAEWAILFRTLLGEIAAIDDQGRTLELPSTAAFERLHVRVGEPRRNDFVRADMARVEPFDWKTHVDGRLSSIPGYGGFSTQTELEDSSMAAFPSGLLAWQWYFRGQFEPRDRWSLGDGAICMQYGDGMIVVYGLDPVEVRAVVRGSGPIPVPIVRYRATLDAGLSSDPMPQATTTTTTTTPPH